MDDQELKQKLQEKHTWISNQIQAQESYAEAAREWTAKIAVPAFARLKQQLTTVGGLADVTSTVGPQTHGSWGELKFKHKETDTKLSYRIYLQVSASGVTAETHFEAPLGVTDARFINILEWKEGDVIEDFLKGYNNWIPI